MWCWSRREGPTPNGADAAACAGLKAYRVGAASAGVELLLVPDAAVAISTGPAAAADADAATRAGLCAK